MSILVLYSNILQGAGKLEESSKAQARASEIQKKN